MESAGEHLALTAAILIVLALTASFSVGHVYLGYAVESETTVTIDGTGGGSGISIGVSDGDGILWWQATDSNRTKLTSPVFECPGTTDDGPRSSSPFTYPVRVKVLDCNRAVALLRFDGSSSNRLSTLGTKGPTTTGASEIRIHEFRNETMEAAAFDAGTLDLMDWPAPRNFVDAWVQPDGLVASGRAGLSKSTSLAMSQVDVNNWNFPTNNKALRQALGYLIDREEIVNVFAGGLAVPICAGTAAGQPGAKSCTQLGYPTSFGEFNPSKALQVLYEGGWRDSNNNGILEAPGGSSEPTLIFYVRQDDSIRRQAGDQLTQALLHLPKSFVSKSSPVQTVCAATVVCKINVDEKVLPRSQIAPIVFRATGYNLWNLYTGAWGLGFNPDHLFYLYTTGYAWSTCGGSWTPNTGALNLPCNVDLSYDTIAQPMVTGATYNDVLTSARATQQYAWGYAGGKIVGTMPTIPLYSQLDETAFYNSDVGSEALVNPDGTHASWKGWVNPEVGLGPGQSVSNTASVSLYNGQTGGPSYASYRGQGILDWGFKSPIQRLNIITSESILDRLVMQHVYDSCLTRNPVKPAEIIPSMCTNFGSTLVFNTALSSNTTVAVYNFRDGLFWSDGQAATADDFKFSIEYPGTGYLFNYPLVESVLKVDVVGADPARGIGGTAIVYFYNVGALFTQNTGFLPIIEKKLWCNSWPNLVADCAYPAPDLFPDFDFTKHVGTGPYVIDSCTGVSCSGTITLKPNPYFNRGTPFFDIAAGKRLQPDINYDNRINQEDLDLLDAANPNDPVFDVDYRMQTIGSETLQVDPSVGSGVFTVRETGPQITSNDRYIINRLIFEGQQAGECDATCNTGGLVWAPARTVMTHVWPDATKDNTVNLDDLINVYLHQFQDPNSVSDLDEAGRSVSLNDVDYSGDISLDDLLITYVRQFTKPTGMP